MSDFPPPSSSPTPATDVDSATVRRRLGCLGAVLASTFLVTMVVAAVAALVAIWPGSMRWTSSVLCPSGFDDAFIVRDTYNVRPGETSTTFTMYCMNARGELHDAGSLRPVLLQLLAVGAATLVVLAPLVLWLRARLRRRRRAAFS